MQFDSNSQRRHNKNADPLNGLMSNIEKKLLMLASDGEQSYIGAKSMMSPAKYDSMMSQHDNMMSPVKQNSRAMDLADLEVSAYKPMTNSNFSFNSTLMSRINQMEEFYMKEIQQFTSKVAHLHQINQELKTQVKVLEAECAKLRVVADRRQKDNERTINQELEAMRQGLMQRFADETEQHYTKHIEQLRIVNEQLQEERKKRRYLQEEVQLLQSERNNYEQFYKELLGNHRQMIKMDMEKSERNEEKNKYHFQKPKTKAKRTDKSRNASRSYQDSPKTKTKPSTKIEGRELNKDELIPFLAKGIQQLKQKLKM